jgi:hypothetical protein
LIESKEEFDNLSSISSLSQLPKTITSLLSTQVTTNIDGAVYLPMGAGCETVRAGVDELGKEILNFITDHHKRTSDSKPWKVS